MRVFSLAQADCSYNNITKWEHSLPVDTINRNETLQGFHSPRGLWLPCKGSARLREKGEWNPPFSPLIYYPKAIVMDRFTFFGSYYDSVEHLDADIKLEFFDALFRYALRDEEPDGMSPIADALFTMVRPNIDKSKERREAGRSGGKKTGSKAKLASTSCSSSNKIAFTSDVSDKDKDKDKDKKEDKEQVQEKGQGKRRRFTPPTINELSAYIAEYSLAKKREPISPEKFMTHYESNGWMVGKNKMKDWKAAVRKWHIDQPEIQSVMAGGWSS